MNRSQKESEETFSPEETQQRFEAALRGARLAESKPMNKNLPKRNPDKVNTKPAKAKPAGK
jgi:hypothetical protein